MLARVQVCLEIQHAHNSLSLPLSLSLPPSFSLSLSLYISHLFSLTDEEGVRTFFTGQREMKRKGERE